MDFAAKLPAGLDYAGFLAAHGTDEQRRRWAAVHAQIQLTAAQRELLASFRREMPVICVAGAWCGDCVNQCPIFDHFEKACPRIKVHYFDRDAHTDLADELAICGGRRVPVVVFLAEDNVEVGRYGDRTLAKYRSVAAELSGAACPTGLVAQPQELLSAVVQDWLNEFERA